MINGVELPVTNLLHQVGKFERDHPIGFQQDLQTFDEGQQIRYMRKNIVAEQEGPPRIPRLSTDGLCQRQEIRPWSECPCGAQPGATFAAGSIPRTGTPRSRKYWSK